jgi:radical SAM protein with 4Fe4S-binding SPASM domain
VRSIAMSVRPVQPAGSIVLPRYLQPPIPSVFTLEITQRCQHHCVGCGNVFAHKRQEMDDTNWAAILERLHPHIKALRVTGGEPTLHGQFGRMMELVDSVGVPFVVFTNGNWADPQATIQILGGCANLRGILISLHGADPAGYLKFTGVDAFAAVTENIRQAAVAGLRVATNTLLLTTTFQRIAGIVDLVTSLGAATISFGRYYGRTLPDLSLTASQLRTALVQIANLRRQAPGVMLSNCVPACFLPGVDFGERGCTSGFTHCTIGPEGDVRPCTHTPLILGHIQDNDIEELWQSPKLDEWRQRIPAPCLTCTALSSCRGGCRATAQQTGLSCDPLMTTPLAEPRSVPIVELAVDQRPRLVCSVESTQYGYTLNGAGHFVTLSHHSRSILQALDGHLSVGQLYDRFGSTGLQLVGSLLQKRLVELG